MSARLLGPTILIALLLSGPAPSEAREWFVSAGASGTGTAASPFGRIQDGLNAAVPGDVVTVRPGTYAETLRTTRGGSPSQPILLRAQAGRGTVVVSVSGRVLRVEHPYVVVDGLVFDGRYGTSDTITLASAAHFFVLRNSEVRRSSRDLIDMGAPQGVLIEHCLLHHALNAAGGRADAHGIVAGAVQDLTVRGTEIHTFSGDGVQLDPARAAPGWTRMTIENSRIWLAPLAAAENGFAMGAVPGENAVDTKTGAASPRATMTIRNTAAWGFRGGLISNMAAFNLKENVEVVVDGVTVFDSEIAFRLRGPSKAAPGAHVTIKNAVIHDTSTAFRYEDDIEQLRIWNSTAGEDVGRGFQAVSSTIGGLEVRNLLVVGPKPREASHGSNLSVGADAFVNAGADDYELAAASPAIDSGVALPDVRTDRLGTPRPQGARYDVGAYERVARGARQPTNGSTP